MRPSKTTTTTTTGHFILAHNCEMSIVMPTDMNTAFSGRGSLPSGTAMIALLLFQLKYVNSKYLKENSLGGHFVFLIFVSYLWQQLKTWCVATFCRLDQDRLDCHLFACECIHAHKWMQRLIWRQYLSIYRVWGAMCVQRDISMFTVVKS